MSRNKWTDADFIKAVGISNSIANVCRELGLKPAGGNYQTINRKIDELQLNIEHMTGKGWNVGGKFQPMIARSLEDIFTNDRPYKSDLLRKRLIGEGYKDPTCESCGLSEWLGQPIALELEHVDGDHDNNSLDNLQILCPNCHAQTPTYRGRNKGIKDSSLNRQKQDT